MDKCWLLKANMASCHTSMRYQYDEIEPVMGNERIVFINDKVGAKQAAIDDPAKRGD